MSALRNNKERASWATYSIGALLFLELLSMVFTYLEMEAIEEFLETYDQQILVNSDDRQQLLAVAYIIMLIVNAVIFVRWFRRAYYNLHQVSNELEFDESAATSAWFIPFVNLYRPLSIMRDMWNNLPKHINMSSEELSKYRSVQRLLGLWWTLWIIGRISDRVSAKMPREGFEGIMTSDYVSLGSSVIVLASGGMLLYILTTYSKLEGRLQETGVDQFEGFGEQNQEKNWES